jgi:hypothetical protein
MKTQINLISIALIVISGLITNDAMGTEWQHDPLTPGDWYDPNNWSYGVPTITETVEIKNNGHAQIIGGNAKARRVFIGNNGAAETGQLTQEGGLLTIDEHLSIATNWASSGTYTLRANGELIVGTDEKHGGKGSVAIFEHESGTHTVTGTLYLSYNGWGGGGSDYWGSTSHYTLSAGELNAGNEVVAHEGPWELRKSEATFIHLGGDNNIDGSLHLGQGWNTKGAYNLENGNLNVVGNEHISEVGRGEFYQTGGVHTVNGSVYIGYQYSTLAGSNPAYEYVGKYDLQGGEFNVQTNEHVGYYQGRGTFTQSGGTHVVSYALEIGTDSDLGIYEISGGVLDANDCVVGEHGTFTIKGNDAVIHFDNYLQANSSTLELNFNGDGVSPINVSNNASISGVLNVVDSGAPYGRFNAIIAAENILGSFTDVYLPGSNWLWGIDDDVLWIQHLPDATVTVLSPNGSEELISDSVHTLTWSSEGAITNVKLEYSDANGIDGTWEVIDASTPNDCEYDWTVPEATSEQCLIRVSDISDPNNIFDVSDGVFTIYECVNQPVSDLNNDCKVNFADLAIFALDWLFNGNPFDSGYTEPLLIMWVYIDNDPGIGSGYEGFNGYMSKYETTNAQYCQFLNEAYASGDITVDANDIIGANGSNGGEDFVGELYYDAAGLGGTIAGAVNGGAARINYNGSSFAIDSGFDDHPVTYVSWYGATAFCNYYGYRLPTEWEWQAVADYDGTFTYGCGASIDVNTANYSDSPHQDGTTAVGSFGTYGYGMCDMAGNVWEWTNSGSPNFVIRGGSWRIQVSGCTVSYKDNDIPGYSGYVSGFRVCR